MFFTKRKKERCGETPLKSSRGLHFRSETREEREGRKRNSFNHVAYRV